MPEAFMQMAMTLIAVVAGLILSLAVALVTEELIFGQIMRSFFSPQTARSSEGVNGGQKR
jgi:uncharacterized membrane protein YraQ (UPF0718 family)